jgi:hypothetical protein
MPRKDRGSPAAKAYERAYNKRYREQHLDSERERGRRYMRERRLRDNSLREYANAYRRALRVEVLAAYGGKCACCGESAFEFMTIDHIHGGGNKHRKSLGGGGLSVYTWLKRSGFPAGFRVLCMNCNFADGKFGGCPHQKNSP